MLSVVIQAGGRSSRMGEDKGLVALAGRPMIEHVLTRVAGLSDETLITTNEPDDYEYLGLRMASDPEPGAGALPGLRTALEAARGDTVLVLACDLPFVNRLLLEYMLEQSNEADVVVPRWNETYQTLHAVYNRKRTLRAVEQALAEGERRMISFYPQLRVRTVTAEEIQQFDPKGRSFFNVNTPEELQEAERLLAELRGR
ncbi:MAG: molybdenum cofactor guanylyltransferase [Anaerolineae bacterium]|nr:molybdenum cofactor guanylyltransferase [Anaerolineae bacterium]